VILPFTSLPNILQEKEERFSTKYREVSDNLVDTAEFLEQSGNPKINIQEEKRKWLQRANFKIPRPSFYCHN
jgi:hypothetical protein